MFRLTALFLLGSAGLVLSPKTASAQFGPAFPNSGAPVIVPSFNPFFYVPQYRFQSGFGVNLPSMYGGFSLGSRSVYQGVTPLWVVPAASGFYQQGGAVTSGGQSVRPNLGAQIQRDLARAQREAGLPGAGSSSGSSGAAAVVPAGGSERGPAGPDGVFPPLTPAERARVVSGEGLNELLAAVVKAQAKGGDTPSAFVAPMQLNDITFAGSDAADLLNLARKGALDLPAAFDAPAAKEVRAALIRDFAAVATPLQAGKGVDPARRAQLEATLQRAEAALAPVVKGQGFEDATAARRFLNQLHNAAEALKGGTGAGLIDPRWAAEGTTVADLARHMTRHKLQFAAAPAGNEDAYTDLHRNFVTYLVMLTQPKR